MKTETRSTELPAPADAFEVPAAQGAPRRTGQWAPRAVPWLATLAILAVWELASRTGMVPSEIPPVTTIVGALATIVPTSEFVLALTATLSQFAIGLIVGALVGLAIGVAIGAIPVLYRLLHYPLDFLRFVPAVVYLPLLLLLFGATPRVSTLLGAIGALWPMLYQTYYGVSGVNDVLRDTGRVFGLRPHQRLRHIVLPTVLPFVATGVRIAASHVLVVVVAVEIISAVRGIGADIAVYASNAVYPEMYALVFVVGILGVVVNIGLRLLERRILHWHVSYRQEG